MSTTMAVLGGVGLFLLVFRIRRIRDHLADTPKVANVKIVRRSSKKDAGAPNYHLLASNSPEAHWP